MSDPLLHSILETARRELLDLSTRNRLLNTPRSVSRSGRLDIVDELSAEVFRRLVVDLKPMSFLPIPDDARIKSLEESKRLLFQPGDDEGIGKGQAARHTDDKLQTSLASEQLQKRLLKLYYDAKTYEEEQGVNILFIAIGFLKWYEDANSEKERNAPLLLVPVTLDRQSAAAKFRVRYTEDEITTNLSLQERLKADFGIRLPDVPDVEELSPQDYFAKVSEAVRSQPRWEVCANDLVLWFFSFSKFLMYRDLIPESWPKDHTLESRQLIKSILREGFRSDAPICSEDAKIDSVIDCVDMVHVVDADSSQAIVIEEVKRGRNLVIQGPPGTGKSQTIANLIAAGVKAGKSVLFVAEKMAALEVVKRRLANVGLGDMCLELHSNKANKQIVLKNLERTLQLGQPHVGDINRHCKELDICRQQLNQYLQFLHLPVGRSGFTPYQILGELVRLRASGTRPPNFKLADPQLWTRSEFQSRLNLVRDLVRCMEELGPPQSHPWRGVELDVALPTDVDRIVTKIPAILEVLKRLCEASARLAKVLGIAEPGDAVGTSRIALLARRIINAPPMDRASIGNDVWRTKRHHIDSLIEAGKQLANAQQELTGVITDSGWQTDVATARQDLAKYGQSWFRFLSGRYRNAHARLCGILHEVPPKPLKNRLALLDGLIHGQKVRDYLLSETSDELGRHAFGSFWNGIKSDWTALTRIAQWETECRDANIDTEFRAVCARVGSTIKLGAELQVVARDLKPLLAELRGLFEALKLNSKNAFQSSELTSVPWGDLSTRLRSWKDNPESLSTWVNYFTRLCSLAQEGMAQLGVQIRQGETDASDAVARFEMAFFEDLIRDVFRSKPELASFNGISRERLIEKFKRLDEARIDLARQEVAMAHFRRLPIGDSDVGEVGLVRREMQKKRRHLPIRKLISQAGRALQAIKPVFMMSPISVAQYLEPGSIEFDMLLIDEASQVEPVDALGAAARAKQIVVVGDSKQLPPTQFFSRMVGEGDSDESPEQSVTAGDLESILGLCCAQNVPQRMLRWHYRSRHHSLIAVSNHEFYDDRLHVIPSPGISSPGQGLIFQYVPEGSFDRGGSATNRTEAKAVAKAVMAHARNSPQKSLGVGAFSVAQRDAILDELELLRRANPSHEPFFVTAGSEPFFVKNLENIQGDERDVIFISVGYGRDESGFLAMTFGPLSGDGGERRLNVLITRAKECCCVFSSIRADDIDLGRARARGAQALKTFLKYAESGLLDTGSASNRDHDSEFERQVAKSLATYGYQTDAQVGVAGFFIDLAVVDPDLPGRYVLGIECDGANYHSCRSARDRDRLRQVVLEDRGWTIHRIWSTDWFQRPDEQVRKTIAAIEAAKAAPTWHSKQESDHAKIISQELNEIVRVDRGKSESKASRLKAEPYEVAAFRVKTDVEIHELPLAQLAQVIAKIVDIEGPIHREEVARRVTQLWGLQRTGNRIRDAVDSAIECALRNLGVVDDRSFLMVQGRQEIPVRDRADVGSPTLRRPEMIPPWEIKEALSGVVRVNLGVDVDDAVNEAARLFGFRSTSPQIRSLFLGAIDDLIRESVLSRRGNKLYATEPAVTA